MREAFNQRIKSRIPNVSWRIRIRNKVANDCSAGIGAKKKAATYRKFAKENDRADRRQKPRIWRWKLAQVKPGFQEIVVIFRIVFEN